MKVKTAEGRRAARGLYEAAMRRVVEFWFRPPGSMSRKPFSAILAAASGIYGKGLARDQARARRRQVKLPVPAVSIGNIVAGGTGKTPLVLWLCRFLEDIGRHPAILSRGYGRTGTGASRVPSSSGQQASMSEMFGDEPVLLAGALPLIPVWVGRDRVVSGNAALADGADVLVLDDGFQHLALGRDLDIVLLDSRHPFGNGMLLPSGPLREPVSHLARADVFVLTHAEACGVGEVKALIEDLFPDKPVFSCRHRTSGIRLPGLPSLEPRLLAGRRCVAFAGIARPAQFFKSLEDAGIEVCAGISFPDHYRYRDRDLDRVLGTAGECGAEFIVTTAKDAVRVPGPYRELVAVLDIDIDFGSDHDRFRRFVASRLDLGDAVRE